MFKRKQLLSDVYNYRLCESSLYYLRKDGKIFRHLNGIDEFFFSIDSIGKFLLFDGKMYVFDASYTPIHNCCIEIPTKKVIRNFSAEGIVVLQLEGALESKKIGLRYASGSYAVYDIEKEKVLFNLSGRFFLLNFSSDTYFALEDRKSKMMHCYNQSTNLWELDLSGYGRLKRIFGIVDNVLWLWCEDYYFIGVDVSSGSIKKVWEVFDGVYERGRFYFYYPYFDKEEGKIYFFERNSYIECDLRNYATEILWRDKELNENISGPHFTNDYIYFTSSRLNSVFNDRLGVFDRKKMQIIWKEKFDLSQGAGFKIPNVVGDFLYVHDTGNTLHIYEKSDTSLS